MTNQTLFPQHPVLACAQTVDTAVEEAFVSNPVFLTTEQKRAALVSLARAKSRLDALELSVLACAGDIAEEEAARDAGPWVAAATLRDPGPTHRRVRLAQAVDTRWNQVAAGMMSGLVNAAQAPVVVAALEALTEPLPPDPLYPERGAEPRHIPPAVLAEVEAALVEACADHTPRELRVLGERILAMVAPTIAEQDELRRLEREEARAAAATRLALRKRGDGSTDLTGRIPDAAASRLRTYLYAFTAPRHDTNRSHHADCDRHACEQHPANSGQVDSPFGDPGACACAGRPSRFLDSTGKRLPADRVLGEAFVEFLNAADPDRMPIQGGSATTVVVTIDYAALCAERGMGRLADGTPITAGEVRRLACQAGIIPAVLGGDSEVLDWGTEKRFHTTPQRGAMALEHPVCRAEHCTVPADWCEAHHKIPWSQGGETSASRTVPCSAPGTTTAPTTPATPTNGSPTATSDSTDDADRHGAVEPPHRREPRQDPASGSDPVDQPNG